VLVVHGKDGMDEISLGAATLVGELRDGEVREYEIHPEDFGLLDVVQPRPARRQCRGVEGDGAGVLANTPGPTARDRLLNAGAALYAANIADSIGDGIAKRARQRGDRQRRGARKVKR
jgi:anthranilate phosphoribosyltransferase